MVLGVNDLPKYWFPIGAFGHLSTTDDGAVAASRTEIPSLLAKQLSRTPRLRKFSAYA
jgi:hypothetical protein